MPEHHQLAQETVDLGPLTLDILRPPDSEALISEEAFDRDEFLPYWAELWPSGIALARYLADNQHELARTRVLELGCGLGLPSIVAARAGATVVASDWAVDALELLRENAARNGASLEVVEARWTDHDLFTRLSPFAVVLAADVLYEQRNADEILALLPIILGANGRLLLSDPGRHQTPRFLTVAEGLGYEDAVVARLPDVLPRGAIHSVRRSERPARR